MEQFAKVCRSKCDKNVLHILGRGHRGEIITASKIEDADCRRLAAKRSQLPSFLGFSHVRLLVTYPSPSTSLSRIARPLSPSRLSLVSLANMIAENYRDSDGSNSMDPAIDLIDQMSILIQRGSAEGAVGLAEEQVFTQHSWNMLQRLANKLRTAVTEPKLYEFAVKGLLELTGGELVSYKIPRLDEGIVETVATSGTRRIPLASQFSLQQSAVELVLIRKSGCTFNDLGSSLHPDHQVLASAGLECEIAVPICYRDQVTGVLSVAHSVAWEKTAEIQVMLTLVSKFLEASIDRIKHKTTAEKILATLEYEANHDALTKLPNRKWFLKTLKREVEQSNESGRPFALLFLDLDDFKKVNDCLSHRAGDNLLQLVAGRIKGEFRSDDVVARLGGDEFVVLIRNNPNIENVQATVQRLLLRIRQPFIIERREVVTGASIGLSFYPEHGSCADDLLASSDVAMYSAKRVGKNQCHSFTKTMADEAKERHFLETELEEAIENESLQFAFQPQRTIESNTMVAVEALIRWEHPTLGTISPTKFLPISEEVGFVTKITELALQQACQAIVEIRKLEPKAYVSVNVSALDFLNVSLLNDRIESALDKNRLPGNALELELTERVFFKHTAAAQKAIKVWHDAGIRLAIDDFGTGYSSLKYLLDLHIDTLKIDRSFVSGIESNHRQQMIVRTILAMANSLGAGCIAEGVETEDELRCLTDLGCCTYQGYYGGRPQGLSAVLSNIAK